ALTYATAHSAMLRALVVVDIGTRLRSGRRMQLLRRLPQTIYRDEADLLKRFSLLPSETRADPGLFQHLARQSVRPLADDRPILKFDRATMVRQPCDISAELPRIICPTLLVRGSESQNLSKEMLVAMISCCPQAQGAEISHAGHHVFLDNPEAFV